MIITQYRIERYTAMCFPVHVFGFVEVFGAFTENLSKFNNAN